MDSACGELAEDIPVAPQERRMQVRAYNFWASRLGSRAFPDAAGFDPADLPDFGPHGVLLDLGGGADRPAIAWLGSALVEEAGISSRIRALSDVPRPSLLARITDRHGEVLASRAPVGFEADFVNRHGVKMLYRGILLPFSRDCVTIDAIFGVINGKERADLPEAVTDGELAAPLSSERRTPRAFTLSTKWADGPAAGSFLERGAALDERAAQGLRALAPRSPDDLCRAGEFTLLVARRNEQGELLLLGEVLGDEALAQATRRLLG